MLIACSLMLNTPTTGTHTDHILGTMSPPASFDLSSDDFRRMPKSQFLRRSFGNSQNTSPGSKRGSTRINKPSGVSFSPHDIQRRRTTASHPVRSNHTVSQTNTPFGRSTVGGAALPSQSKRPMSWHPGSGVHQEPAAVPFLNDSTIGDTIAELETLAVSGSVQPVYDQSAITRHFTTRSGDPFASTATGYIDWVNMGMDPNVPYLSYPEHGLSNINQYYPNFPYECSYARDGFSTSDLVQTEAIHTNCQIPSAMDSLAVHNPAAVESNKCLGRAPQIATKKSKELVGMGLYDDKNGSMVSANQATSNQSPDQCTNFHRASLGKGLKLEETWQPPSDDPTEEVEDYSSDEGEDDLPVASPLQQRQPQAISEYKDLSNQTFFFESDDHYSNYMAFDQAIQFYEEKAPDPSTGNFLWF